MINIVPFQSLAIIGSFKTITSIRHGGCFTNHVAIVVHTNEIHDQRGKANSQDIKGQKIILLLFGSFTQEFQSVIYTRVNQIKQSSSSSMFSTGGVIVLFVAVAIRSSVIMLFYDDSPRVGLNNSSFFLDIAIFQCFHKKKIFGTIISFMVDSVGGTSDTATSNINGQDNSFHYHCCRRR